MPAEFPGPRRCSSCRYFFEELSECRRHPPQVFAQSAQEGGESVDTWPLVDPDEWCGDYRKAVELVSGRKPGRPPLPTLTREQKVAAVAAAIMETLAEASAVGIAKAARINPLMDAVGARCGKTVAGSLTVPVLKDLLRSGKLFGGWPGDHPAIPHVDQHGNGGAMFWLPEKFSTAAPSGPVPEVTIE